MSCEIEIVELLERYKVLGARVEKGPPFDSEWMAVTAELGEVGFLIVDWLVASIPVDLLAESLEMLKGCEEELA